MEKVVAIINSNKTAFTEADRPWLLLQEETTLDKLMPKDETPVVHTEKKDEVQTLSAEDQAALEFGKRMLREKRQKLIAGIQANVEKDTWSDADLNAMSETLLEKIYNSVKVKEDANAPMDWSLNGNAILDNSKEDDDLILLPTGYETKKEEKGGK
jgi:hypothetical protein